MVSNDGIYHPHVFPGLPKDDFALLKHSIKLMWLEFQLPHKSRLRTLTQGVLRLCGADPCKQSASSVWGFSEARPSATTFTSLMYCIRAASIARRSSLLVYRLFRGLPESRCSESSYKHTLNMQAKIMPLN